MVKKREIPRGDIRSPSAFPIYFMFQHMRSTVAAGWVQG